MSCWEKSCDSTTASKLVVQIGYLSVFNGLATVGEYGHPKKGCFNIWKSNGQFIFVVAKTFQLKSQQKIFFLKNIFWEQCSYQRVKPFSVQ